MEYTLLQNFYGIVLVLNTIIAHSVMMKMKPWNIYFMIASLLMSFGEDLHDWLFPKFVNFSNLTKENILYGIPVKDPTHDLGINTIIILAKFFIHKKKFMKTKPQIYVFHKELCHYFSSLKCMEKKTAVSFMI